MSTGDASSSAAKSVEPGGRPVSATVNTGEQTCATLILTVRQAIDPLAAGDVLAVISRDPSARIDLPAWCRMTGHIYAGAEDRADEVIHYLRK